MEPGRCTIQCSMIHVSTFHASMVHVCGAGGSRTLVQTRNKNAFYMLSPLLIVGQSEGTDARTLPYLLKSRRAIGALAQPA